MPFSISTESLPTLLAQYPYGKVIISNVLHNIKRKTKLDTDVNPVIY